MKTMFNFGDPHKDFHPVAKEILGDYGVMQLPITNNNVFFNNKYQIVDACYGAGMVLDSLTMMEAHDHLSEGDKIMFLGSMGSLSHGIHLDDLVVPIKVCCAYYGYENDPVRPDKWMMKKMVDYFDRTKLPFVSYIHGSVFAVCDPTTDLVDYSNRLYGSEVEGIDCSESYIGLNFCRYNGLAGAVLLYCSDDPEEHISNIPKEEFDQRALQKDLEIHRIAKQVLF